MIESIESYWETWLVLIAGFVGTGGFTTLLSMKNILKVKTKETKIENYNMLFNSKQELEKTVLTLLTKEIPKLIKENSDNQLQNLFKSVNLIMKIEKFRLNNLKDLVEDTTQIEEFQKELTDLDV